LRSLLDAATSEECRGLNKGAEVCKSLLEHDGLQALEAAKKAFSTSEPNVARRADRLMCEFIPMIWS
jgi:hypothetical protein